LKESFKPNLPVSKFVAIDNVIFGKPDSGMAIGAVARACTITECENGGQLFQQPITATFLTNQL
jgi:hypothetical protein